jgi:hypothetical protein
MFAILNPSPFVTLSEALHRMVYRAKRRVSFLGSG